MAYIRHKDVFVSLKLKDDIAHLFKQGDSYKNSNFAVRYCRISRGQGPPVKILWCTPRKLGKAHVRNKFRRVSKEVFFHSLVHLLDHPTDPLGQPSSVCYHLAFIPFPNFLAIPFTKKIQYVHKMLVYIQCLQASS